MSNSMYRYYKPKENEKIKGYEELVCETITPMFLGNANQEAEWRSAPFKSLLRYWWRVTQHECDNSDVLKKEEAKIFGSAGDEKDKNSGKSSVLISIVETNSTNEPASKQDFVKLPKIRHPECKRMLDPLLYLAGIGLIHYEKGIQHSYFPVNSKFKLTISYPFQEQNFQNIFALIHAFGAIGARCRNGWGSFQIKADQKKKEEFSECLKKITKNWEKGMQKDYPNCLGEDDKKQHLLWKTKGEHQTWTAAMGELASAYIRLRTEELPLNTDCIPEERHLLGVPLTNHPKRGKWDIEWEKKGWKDNRHASPLRFVVHKTVIKTKTNFHGFMLHIPHSHSKQMQFPNKINEIQMWQKVHKKLDSLLKRVSYKECLL